MYDYVGERVFRLADLAEVIIPDWTADPDATECPLLEEHVEITGTSRDDLNGKAGIATSFDHAQGRYAVHLDETPEAVGG